MKLKCEVCGSLKVFKVIYNACYKIVCKACGAEIYHEKNWNLIDIGTYILYWREVMP